MVDNMKSNASVMLTDRDFLILESLYSNVVMSFPQISQRYFVGRSKPTVINRLTRLESAGLIAKFKVPRLALTGAQNVISVVYRISKSGIQALQKRYPGFEFRVEPIRIKPFSIDHDLLLVDVVQAMKPRFQDYKIINGELFNGNQGNNGLKPDAIFTHPNGHDRIALELELTAKSEKRYRELILKYRLSKEFSKVIYVTSHNQIESKIKTILGPSIASGRFEFVNLKCILPVNQAQINNTTLHQPDEKMEANI